MLTHTTLVLAVLSTVSLSSARMERVERQGQSLSPQLMARAPAEDPSQTYELLKRSTFDPFTSQLETRSAMPMPMPMSPIQGPKLVARKTLTSAEKKAAKKAKCAAKKKAAAKAAAAKKAAASSTSNVNLSVKVSSGHSLIGYSDKTVGSSGASSATPNGAENWLNNGIKSGGWNPPFVSLNQLASVSIEQALASNSVWAPCKAFASLFEKYGDENGIPPIMLAAFAMQESTCDPTVIGDNGGAFGLMQITKDKCNGLSEEACRAPDYNIATGASYFASAVKAAGGNVLVALGEYNGWYPGMTYEDATKAAHSGCCVCQNNLDYLTQMLNGWMMGKTGYEMGSFQNLAVCGKDS